MHIRLMEHPNWVRSYGGDVMPIDRDLVDKFLLDVDRSLLPYIRAGSAKLYGYQKLN